MRLEGEELSACSKVRAGEGAVALQARQWCAVKQAGAADGSVHDVAAEVVQNAADRSAAGDVSRVPRASW